MARERPMLESRIHPLKVVLLVACPLGLLFPGCEGRSSDSGNAAMAQDSAVADEEDSRVLLWESFGVGEWVAHYSDPESGASDSVVVETGRSLSRMFEPDILEITPIYERDTEDLRSLLPPDVLANLRRLEMFSWSGPDSLHLTRGPGMDFVLDESGWIEEEDGVFVDPDTEYMFSIATAFGVSLDAAYKANGNTNNRVSELVQRACPVRYSVEEVREAETPRSERLRSAMRALRDSVAIMQTVPDSVLLELVMSEGHLCHWTLGSPENRRFVFFDPVNDLTRVVTVYPETNRMWDTEAREGEDYMHLVREGLIDEGRVVSFPIEALLQPSAEVASGSAGSESGV